MVAFNDSGHEEPTLKTADGYQAALLQVFAEAMGIEPASLVRLAEEVAHRMAIKRAVADGNVGAMPACTGAPS